jgi:hypothetical protein
MTGFFRAPLPPSYLKRCEASGHKPITAIYVVWLVTKKKLRPAVVPGYFTTTHLDQLPADERKRWLRVSRARYVKAKRLRVKANRRGHER